MADENNSNGKNGKVGLVERVTTGVKDDIQSIKTDLPAKAKEQIDGLKDPTKTRVYTSIFRHKHDDTPRNRALGVDTKFQQKYRIWVDRTPDRLFVIYARCTHLGCTPDWKPSENKFKCPCHGSGYDSEGINFEGPAPRPMDRAHIELAPDGQVLVDTSKLYSWPKGQPSKFNDPGAFLTGV